MINNPTYGTRGGLQRKPATALRNVIRIRMSRVAGVLFAHMLLGPLLYQSQIAATLHALATISIGFYYALKGARYPHRVACVAGYIVGSEVLWRMSGAAVFYEGGKYGIVAILLLALLVRRTRSIPPWPALIYGALLLPSIAVTLANVDPEELRGVLSFNLSGPLSLLVCVWFFSQTELSIEQLGKIFLAIICPLISIAVVTLFATVTNQDVTFGTQSNYATSAGFGPNQVSAALGLGVFLILLTMFLTKSSLKFKAIMLCILVLLSVQSALTFSRGGLYNAAAAASLAAFFLFREAKSRTRVLASIALVLSISYYILLPAMDSFTGGALSERFQDTDTTGRVDIIKEDLEIWSDNAIFGVGPGRAIDYREEMGHRVSAHTEFTRLLSEHGMFGLGALAALVVMVLMSIKKASTTRDRALIISMSAWSFLFMSQTAMRTAAPAYLLGLTFALLASGIKARRIFVSGESRKPALPSKLLAPYPRCSANS